jgi:putative membrane protein
MLWIKALHIIFVVTWFAGLFYLPRLFVYHCTCTDAEGHERFKIMERRLMGIMTIGGLAAVGFGLALLPWWGHALRSGAPWLYLKLMLVAALVGFHVYCGVLVQRFRDGTNRRGERFFRIINEFPALVLVAVVVLVVVKPG